MSHLDRMFFDIPGYAGVDVESKRMENHRIIHEYLDNPTFDPNVYDSQNRTPLYLAVERSRDDVIDKLLKHPDINTDIRETQSGKTPLELAIARRNYKAIALFKKYKKVPKALKDLV
jgi:ankyrin repeat protein